MAFSYLNILACRIELLLHESNTIPDQPFREILQFAQSEVKSVEEIAARMNWMGLQSLEREIIEETANLLYKIEGAVQSHFSKLASESSSVELEGLKEEIQNFVARVKKMGKEYADEMYNPLPLQEEEGDDGIDVSVSCGLELKMIGLSDQYDELKEKLLEATYFEVVPLVGMPGIGKTTLARKVFADPDIVKRFEVHVWVKLGRKCLVKEIPRRILARVDPDRLDQTVEERDISRHLRESLKGKRYLIVLDDAWDKNMVYQLQPSSRYSVNALGDPLPYQNNGSCVLVTTRLQQGDKDLTMRLLTKKESWDLLREKVFGEESCPSQLEKAGKKIAENCEGLPLTIITIADYLSQVKEVEYWNEVAAKKNHKLFKDVYNQISKVLLPSYNYLPRLLQICFLYMGVFPQNYEIPRSKLVDMWNVDGFLERNVSFDALDCLEELVSNSLVVIYKNTTGHVGQKEIKTCGLHSSLWHFSITEARKTKFCHVLISLDDGLHGDIIDQQRLSFHNNILCTIKDVCESVEDNCASTARSLLYYGPYNPYQVPICLNLKLLRELDVLTIRFYEFPMEVLQLVEIRYLTLTLDGKLPASISQLSNLRFLIVGCHFVIIKPSRDRYLPLEIWSMQELQHLQAMGSDLPQPPCGALLENLSTLTNVSASSCTEEVFKAIPNLEKLGFRIELGPNDDGIPLRCFDCISHLERLTSLKCVVVNPKVMPPPRGELTNFRSGLKKLSLSKLRWKERSSTSYRLKSVVVNPDTVPRLAPVIDLPLSLTKLTLSGLGFPWKETTKIASLPNLKVLKLRSYAFRGSDWRVKKLGFPSLQCLVIEDSDIVEWRFGCECFKRLERLTLKHCYKYERMVGRFGTSIRKIGFVDCNAKGIMQMQEVTPLPWIEWRCHFSFIAGETETRCEILCYNLAKLPFSRLCEQNINCKNKELEDRTKQITLEAQSWHYKAKQNESIAKQISAATVSVSHYYCVDGAA